MSIDDDYFDLEADIEELEKGEIPEGITNRIKRILKHVTELEKDVMHSEYAVGVVSRLHDAWVHLKLVDPEPHEETD